MAAATVWANSLMANSIRPIRTSAVIGGDFGAGGSSPARM